ncbi:GDSL-like lipase/acylhydrolase family protein [Chitinophaga niastensis]|uniref:GDSL-like lipase/acylhydrolase family protein n=1 Tax=Chitinophaga niastensis TaxID=536980 RepID=A0A2P8HJC9_CHINA|nr:SGNH/GDSL hydrolase family protein [Chitinophaga niastensis]PSL46322.1 GDSL-like lipase/acylhydrolase family protein [Chitinophaga niastensis]
MKRSITFFLLLQCVAATHIFAQQQNPVKWWNPAGNDFPVLEGQCLQGATESYYDRFSAGAKNTLNPKVWGLSHNSAGLYLKFKSDANEIVVRYVVQNKGNFAMPHMPATGVSGIDLYAIDRSGGWQWAPGHYAFGDTVEYRFSHLQADHAFTGGDTEYRLYLPLYNTVNWLQIGVASEKHFAPMPLSLEKPVVAYGTSIMQGGCASRPGLAWTAILNRSLDRPLINLGFSGTGLLEKSVLDQMVEKDAKIYVLDCLPNLTGYSSAALEQLIKDAVNTLQGKRPEVPILLVEHSGGVKGSIMDTTTLNGFENANKVLRSVFAKLIAEGKQHLYLLSNKDMDWDINATVDGVHPNDVGMMKYAAAYEKIIRRILHEPSGNIRTTIPVTQSRDIRSYDWRDRHQEILALNKKTPPQNIILANSIIHFWGGDPKAPIARGEESWNKYLAPIGMRNLAFGWDRIENVLWRIYHDELDGYQAKHVLFMIGTNNLGDCNDEEIIMGLQALVAAVNVRQPQTQIILSGILPRGNMEQRVETLNKRISLLAKQLKLQYINPGKVLLKKDGKIDESLFSDGLHPVAAGYEKLGQQLQQAFH